MENMTNISVQYPLRHVETRWLSMKGIAVRITNQWENLCLYFLKFLPTQKTFRHAVRKTRYQRIENALESDSTRVCLSFLVFAASLFNNFLLTFQYEEPLIHLLFPKICELYSDLLQKFIKKKLLYTVGRLKDISDLLKIDVAKKENQKPLTLIETSTQSRGFLRKTKKMKSFKRIVFSFM